MLEDSLKRVWVELGGKGLTFRFYNERATSEAITTAREDYLSSLHKKRYTQRCTGDYESKCKLTASHVEQNLLEALSSPNSYIREWGKLIMEEQDERHDAAIK